MYDVIEEMFGVDKKNTEIQKYSLYCTLLESCNAVVS